MHPTTWKQFTPAVAALTVLGVLGVTVLANPTFRSSGTVTVMMPPGGIYGEMMESWTDRAERGLDIGL